MLLPASTLAHSLKNTHTLIMWCVVRHGVQMSGISVLALAAPSRHRGSLSLRKSTKLQSRSAVLISHTQSRARTHTSDRQKGAGRAGGNPKQRKNKSAHMHTKSDRAKKIFLIFVLRVNNNTSGWCFFVRNTYSTSSHIMAWSKKKKKCRKFGIKTKHR